MSAAAVRGSRRHRLTGAAAAAIALLLLLLAAPGARAELVYWGNHGASPGTVGWANVDGSGGGALTTTGSETEGIAYDPVTNRVYVANDAPGEGQISYVGADGTGAGTLTAPGAPVSEPEGVVLDPSTRIAYWLNGGAAPESISWARLDGSEGGVVNVGAAPLAGARRLALDPAAGRLYWGNGDGSIAFAAVDGTGGGTVAAAGATEKPITGLAYYAAAGLLFLLDEAELPGEGKVSSANVAGGGVSPVPTGIAPLDLPWGLALDPTMSNPRLYWANEGSGELGSGAIGLSGVLPGAIGGEISLTAAPVDGPRDPIIIKGPTSVAVPAITSTNRQLNCSQGSWEPDYVSSFFYQSPSSFSYQWLLNELPIRDATDPTYSASVSGRYKCRVTASNPAGSVTRTSLGVVVTLSITTRPAKAAPAPAKLVLAHRVRKLKALPGDRVTLGGLRIANHGAVASAPVKLCLRLTKKAKRALKPGECRKLGPIAGGAAVTSKLRLRVRPTAKPGAYELRIALPGAATKVIVRVLG
jgi:DNA-binding beta-propeller fold protein YncE